MRFVLNREGVQQLVNFVQGFLPLLNSCPPFMADCIIDATSSGVYVEAMNYESQAKMKLDASCEEEGICTVTMKYLLRVLKSVSSSNSVDCAVSGNYLEILDGSSKFRLSTTVSINEFNRMKEPPVDSWVSVVSGDLADAIEFASSAAVKRGRYELSGVFLKIQGKELSVYGTDGKRLVKVGLNYEGSSVKNEVVIHSSTCKIISGICNKFRDEIQLSLGDLLYIRARYDNDTIFLVSVRGMDCEYPNVVSILEQSVSACSIFWRVNKHDLIDVCKKAISIFNTDMCQLIFDLTPDGASCTASHSGNEYIGKIEGQISGSIRFAINAVLLLNTVKAFNVDEVEFGIQSHDKPLVIRETVTLPCGSYIALIMPMRLQ